VVEIAAERWGDKEALKSLYQGQRFTFREVRNEVIEKQKRHNDFLHNFHVQGCHYRLQCQ
jgi:hypothetical protein